MAPRKCYITNQVLDLDRILQESQHRWLRPPEICEILRNHHKFQLTPTPPTTPPAGSLFLFDKKVVRYFRKDGHRWRKKKDGKTIKEAHEKLKAGNVDVLHCYYAHGEENESFQRRSYWMLDEPFENIVLVHYRDVKEGYKSGVPSYEQTASLDRTLPTDPNSAHRNDQTSSSGLHNGLQSDTVSVGSRQQRFSIIDYAPVRAVCGANTNVLVAGVFSGDTRPSDDVKWCCMFGEIEVPAEVVTTNTIRCRVPARAAGRVPFYVTCGDGVACSEVREFEYLDHPSRAAARKVSAREEFGLLVRFVMLVSSRLRPEWAGCLAVDCEPCRLKSVIHWIQQHKDTGGRRVTTAGDVVDLLMRNLVKDRFCEWLVYDAHRAYRGLRAVDGEGQGVVHLAATLGYEWAIAAVAATGGGLDFRDVQGRTALHWAALYGREETVVSLVRLGASAGAVDDPTPRNPAGQTAADLASSSGHKGIAGYLAEADLTSRLSAADGHPSPPRPAGETKEWRCLEAVRKSAHAAALIQDALRARSAATVDEFPDPRDIAAVVSLHDVRKTGRFDDYLHPRIHQKHRNESVKIRERIVNAQARQRGRRAPKRYEKWVWAVGIIEKAVLRWRRRSRGLRGFTAANATATDEYDFLRVGREQKRASVERALARVRSMTRDPEARDQYMRLVSRCEKVRVEERGGASGT